MSRYYYHGWTNDEEKILANAILEGQKSRMKLDEVIKEVSEQLGRTFSACSNRWYGKNGIRFKYVNEMKDNEKIRIAR